MWLFAIQDRWWSNILQHSKSVQEVTGCGVGIVAAGGGFSCGISVWWPCPFGVFSWGSWAYGFVAYILYNLRVCMVSSSPSGPKPEPLSAGSRRVSLLRFPIIIHFIYF